MKRLTSVASLAIFTTLAALSAGSVGCSTEGDDAASADDALGAADRADLSKLLANGKISSATVGQYTSPDGIKIVHVVDGKSAVSEVGADAVEGDAPALDLLLSALQGGVRGTVKNATSFPPYACERSSYGATGDFDEQAIYLMGVDEVTFDLLTRTSMEAAGQIPDREVQLRLSKAQQRVSFAAFLPAKHTVLYFGRDRVTDAQGKTKKVWRIYAADVRSPDCESAATRYPRGTINGKAFAATNGAAYIDFDDVLHLTFSNATNTCDVYEHGRFDAGATYVQINGLKAEVGTSRPPESAALTVDPSCSWGMYVTAGLSFSTSGGKDDTTVKVTRLDSVVEGNVSMKFADGSIFKGDFSFPVCTGMSLGDEERCQ